MLLKITTYKMHDMKQYKKNKTETYTQEENNITKRNESTSCKITRQKGLLSKHGVQTRITNYKTRLKYKIKGNKNSNDQHKM